MGRRITPVALLLFVALFAVALVASPAGTASAQDISVYVDGERLVLDQPPVLEKGRTLVPMRAIFEALGANVNWENTTQTVSARKGETTVQLRIGSCTAYRNGQPVALDVPAKTVRGRTLVPIRFVTEALGAEVNWDGVSRAITILAATSGKKQSTGVESKTGAIKREFAWNYGGKRWTWEMDIPEKSYTYYANLKRPPTDDYSVYVTESGDDSYIASLADRLKEAAAQQKYSAKQAVELAITFVQSIRYAYDSDSKGVSEYPRYPLETLVDQEGDCEDHSILLASILDKMGYGVILVHIPGNPGHVAVGVKGENLAGAYYQYQGAHYYYVETTNTGWLIGEIPEEYRQVGARILPLVPKPVLTHKWSYKWTVEKGRSGWLDLKVVVTNDGTATARNTKVYAALDAGNGLVYDQRWSDSLDIQPRSTGTYSLVLKLPASVSTRLLVKIVSDNILVDESASDWFST